MRRPLVREICTRLTSAMQQQRSAEQKQPMLQQPKGNEVPMGAVGQGKPPSFPFTICAPPSEGKCLNIFPQKSN